MYFLKHAGIALATSIVSWVGTIIYVTVLIKSGKIRSPKFSLKEENFNLFSVIFYSLKILFISIIMVLSMKLVQKILEINNLEEIFILTCLCILGFTMYILTSWILNYIPKELQGFISLKLKKAK